MWRSFGLVLLAAGCGNKDRVIPMWVDGVLVEGFCSESYQTYDSVSVVATLFVPDPALADDPLSSDPNFRMEGLPDPVGTVVRDQGTYEHIVFESMNFAEVPYVDFSTQQAVFVWTKTSTCNLALEEWGVNSNTSNTVVLDVTYYDESLNCASSCEIEHKGVAMVVIGRDNDAAFCRRTRPGCEPDVTVR